MVVIPAINCKNFACVKRRIKKVAEFLPKNSWIQIDISDGKFTPAKTWNSPKQLRDWLFKNKLTKFNIEAHLMVEDYSGEMEKWFAFGAKRVIVHVESLKFKNQNEKLQFKIKNLSNPKRQIGIAINPSTPVKKLLPFLDVEIKNVRVRPCPVRISPWLVQILAVEPGYSGQEFEKEILSKIEFLKKKYPGVKVEVDGGVNEKTIQVIKKAGADIAVSGSFLFKSNNFRKRYIKLF